MLSSYNIKLNSSQVSDALVTKQITLFVEHIAFLWDCFKSIKSWKTIDLRFLKHEHNIPKLVEHPKSKEEKLLNYIYDKEVLLIKCTSKANLFSKYNSKL